MGIVQAQEAHRAGPDRVGRSGGTVLALVAWLAAAEAQLMRTRLMLRMLRATQNAWPSLWWRSAVACEVASFVAIVAPHPRGLISLEVTVALPAHTVQPECLNKSIGACRLARRNAGIFTGLDLLARR